MKLLCCFAVRVLLLYVYFSVDSQKKVVSLLLDVIAVSSVFG